MSAIHWFEIPVTDMQRAARFYGALLAIEVPVLNLREQLGSLIGQLPNRGGVGGHLVQNEGKGYIPNQGGVLIYLVVDGELSLALERAAQAGGQILLGKTALGQDPSGGYVGLITDTEGNRIGLFSNE